jgi:GTP cyclohydrolase II
MHQAQRGLFDLQRGRPLYVTSQTNEEPVTGALLATVEGLTIKTLNQLSGLDDGRARLAVTRHRAEAMGLFTNGHGRKARTAMSLGLAGCPTPAELFRISSSTGRTDARATLDVRQASPAEVGGLTLARLGRFLPAIVSAPVGASAARDVRRLVEAGTVLSVTATQIEAMANAVRVEVAHVSEGPVPLQDAEDARFISFREANGILEHVAVLIGNREQWPEPVPVRIHSACLTGDLFGSLRCDCGEQLRGSLRIFNERGGGVLLYLSQEGRGIGLGNKLRAYALQQEGLDTVDADCTLGFGADERRYDAAVEMLQYLAVSRVQLLTNNPEKVRAVQEGGIEVVDRQPLYGTLNRHNLRYVKAKVHRAGHWLGDMLSGAVPGE